MQPSPTTTPRATPIRVVNVNCPSNSIGNGNSNSAAANANGEHTSSSCNCNGNRTSGGAITNVDWSGCGEISARDRLVAYHTRLVNEKRMKKKLQEQDIQLRMRKDVELTGVARKRPKTLVPLVMEYPMVSRSLFVGAIPSKELNSIGEKPNCQSLQLRGNTHFPCTPLAFKNYIQEGVCESDSLVSFFPLDYFDDLTFESKSPQEWLRSSCRGFTRWYDTENAWHWVECSVIDYSLKRDQYLIEWTAAQKRKYVSRLNLRFVEEDPEVFNHRLVCALLSRLFYETFLGRETRLNMKKLHSMPQLPDSVLEGIKKRLKPVKKLRQETFTQLQNLIKLDYQRIQKRLEYNVRHPPEEDFPEALCPILLDVLKESCPKPTDSLLCKTAIPPSDSAFTFTATFSLISTQLLHTSHNILCTLQNVWATLCELQPKRLLCTTAQLHATPIMSPYAKRPTTLADFRDGQSALCQATIDYVKKDVQPIITGFLIHAINEEAHSTENMYFGSSACCIKLLTLCNLMLSDTLKEIVLLSVQGYCDYFLSYDQALQQTAADLSKSPSQTHIPTWVMGQIQFPPIFCLNINFHEGRLVFNPPLQDFLHTVSQIVNDMILFTKSIPSIEVPTIDIKYHHSFLDILEENDPLVQGIVYKINQCLQRHFSLAEAFRDLIAKEYEPLLTITGEFSKKTDSLASLKLEIDNIMQKEEALKCKLDTYTLLGIFLLDCKQVKDKLASIFKNHRIDTLDNLHRQAYDELTRLTQLYQDTFDILTRKPSTPSELSQVKKVADNVVSELPHWNCQNVSVMEQYQLLEDFGYDICSAEFNQKWSLLGWPSRLKQVLFSVEKITSIERVNMIRDLGANKKAMAERLHNLDATIKKLEKFGSIDHALAAGEQVRQIQKELNEVLEQAEAFCTHEKLFDLKSSDLKSTVQQVLSEFEPTFTLWSSASNWIIQYNNWLQSAFTSLNVEQMSKLLAICSQIAIRLLKQFKGKKESLHGVTAQYKQKIDAFKVKMPLLLKLRHQGVRQRHWEAIAQELGFTLPTGEKSHEFSLGFVLNLNLETHLDTISRIIDVAIHEHTIERALDKMNAELRNYTLKYSSLKETGSLFIHSTEELLDPIANTWKSKLDQVRTIMLVWVQLQKNWMYLGPIFSSPEIKSELPSETRKFFAVDALWNKLLDLVRVNPKILSVCSREGLLKQLEECNKVLEMVHSALKEFLEIKRGRFNRFYFLSNDDLLTILAHARDPTSIQPYLKKCFENVNELEFLSSGSNNQLEIRSAVSSDGEKLVLEEVVSTAVKDIETWLLEFDAALKHTLHQRLSQALASYHQSSREKWLAMWPAQIVLLANQIIFTQRVTRALSTQSTRELQNIKVQLAETLNYITSKSREFSLEQKMTTSALIVMEVHNRDIISELLCAEYMSETTLEWLQHLRYYWEEDNCFVRMLQWEQSYAYEYLGNTSRLVITPLTDRVYRTLTNALHLNLGGASYGPAGTGKTETVRDLSKAVGKMCVVFNCSDSLDYNAVGQMLKGLATSGAWCCFDEFNRIKVEVLSVISSQILAIQQAIATQSPDPTKKFRFGVSDITLNPTCAIFVTMNPGYAGRSELPDNLKALFRPVSMTVADQRNIAEILLYCEGFQEASNLAHRLIKCLQISSHLLSKQKHYDFAMRAVKAVLCRAGALKRISPNLPEPHLLCQAICDTNVPKFLASDLPIFKDLAQVLFPEVDITPLLVPQSIQLHAAISECSKELFGIVPTDSFVGKCIQLYETMIVRHGVMIVGEPASGKTSCYRVLASALNKLAPTGFLSFQGVTIHILNPKAISNDQLFGYMTPTLEWVDGLLPSIIRSSGSVDLSSNTVDSCGSPSQLSVVPASTWHWIVFDGPVDSLWIESLNSVLDDTKVLCLSNGERIIIQPNLSFLFEVQDLSVASPATVSRCGMVFMNATDLQWDLLFASWLKKLPGDLEFLIPHLSSLFSKYLMVTLKRKLVECKSIFQFSDLITVTHLLWLLESLLLPLHKKIPPAPNDNEDIQPHFSRPPSSNPGALPTPPKLNSDEMGTQTLSLWSQQCSELIALSNSGITEKIVALVEPFFLFSVVHTIGCGILVDCQRQFDVILRSAMEENNSCHPFPRDGFVFDYYYSVKSFQWVKWSTECGKGFKGKPTDLKPVPTPESQCRYYLMEALLSLFGDSGIGKTMETTFFLRHCLDTSVFIPKFAYLSQSTSPRSIQYQLESALDKKKSSITLGPPAGKQTVVMLDDCHTPYTAESGAQPPLELLRQYFDHNFWYIGTLHDSSTENTSSNMQFSMRFVHHFFPIFFTKLSDENLHSIISQTLCSHHQHLPRPIQDLQSKIATSCVHLLHRSQRQLYPTASKLHYIFTPNDVFKVICGLLNVPASAIPNSNSMIRLWFHECLRVFCDKLNTESDSSLLIKLLSSVLEETFHIELQMIVSNKSRIWESPLFSDVISGSYSEVTDFERVTEVVKSHLTDFNNSAEIPLELHLFPESVQHILRLLRVLKHQGGHMLLLGMGGSGRQSNTRLAAHIAQMQVEQLSTVRRYSKTQWNEDLKRVIRKAGLQCVPTVFLLNDTQLTSMAFFEDLTNLIHNGNIPDLLSVEDVDAITQSMRASKNPTLNTELASTENLMSQFTAQLKTNLHVVLCMSPFQKIFATSVSLFTPLFTNSILDWYYPWPVSALNIISLESLREFPLGGVKSCKVADACVAMHKTVEDISKKFLSEGGCLEKVKSLSATVREIQDTIEKLLPQLSQMSAETDDLLSSLSKKSAEADATKERIHQEEMEIEKETIQQQELQVQQEEQLKQALPLLQAADNAIQHLSRKEINEIKSLANPPAGMTVVIEALCIIFNRKPRVETMGSACDYWPEARALMDANFIFKLRHFAKEAIPDEAIAALRPYLSKPQFQPSAVERVNASLKSLCLWIRAMERFYWIHKSVIPIKLKVEQTHNRIDELHKKANLSKEKLATTEHTISHLSTQYKCAVDKKMKMQADIEFNQLKLQRAKNLQMGLASEQIIWQQHISELKQQMDTMLGDILLFCGCMTYLGAFTPQYREETLHEWQTYLGLCDIKYSSDFSLVSILGDPIKIRDWTLNGLPSDAHSIDNGVLITLSRTCSLILDPEGQVVKWLVNIELKIPHNTNLITASPTPPLSPLDEIDINSPSLLLILETCVQFGRSLLIEGISDDIDPVLLPLLTFLQRFSSTSLSEGVTRIGDKAVTVNPDFRLYLSTKNSRIHLSPETFAKVNLVNFITSEESVAEQFLAKVVSHEEKKLEEERLYLMKTIVQHKKQLQDLDQEVLTKLYAAQGDILSDEKLVDVLFSTKKTSEEIHKQLEAAEKIGVQISSALAGYQPVAKHAGYLYCTAAKLSRINCMYQFSLDWFSDLFDAVLAIPHTSATLTQRIAFLNSSMTQEVYLHVCRGIFEPHKLIFSFLLAANGLQLLGSLKFAEWKLFLNFGGNHQNDSVAVQRPTPLADTISTLQWESVCKLISIPSISANLVTSMQEFPKFWKEFIGSSTPELMSLPSGWCLQCTPLSSLLLIKALRPERMKEAIQQFVIQHLGKQYVEPPQLDIGFSLRFSRPQKPLIFILSSAFDPTSLIYEFAEQQETPQRVVTISLGGDTGVTAAKAVSQAIDRGDWVLLQNCHLVPSWFPELENIVHSIPSDRVHHRFRLWLTTKPHPEFPVSVLQSAVKITNQPPSGIRANLLRAFSAFDATLLVENMRNTLWHKLLFSVCFFHSILIERFKFGPLGWNKTYEFSDTDLHISQRLLTFLETDDTEQPTPSGELLHIIKYLALECVYGGYISEPFDRRLLATIGNEIFSVQVMQSNYKFSTSGKYYCPEPGTIEDYLEYIRGLPLNDDAEVFDMHDNANMTCTLNEAKEMFETLLQCTSFSTLSTEEEKFALDIVDDFLKRLPQTLDIVAVESAICDLKSILRKEVENYNELLKVVHISLSHLRRALCGAIQYTSGLQVIRQELIHGMVPKFWAHSSYLSSKPLGVWFNDLILRVGFFHNWIRNGTPTSFWLGAFFHPNSFVTGVMQEYAKSLKIPLDRIEMSTEVLTGDSASPPTSGPIIHGLFLEGASWDGTHLARCPPKQLYFNFPPIQFVPTAEPLDHTHREVCRNVYRCPLYITQDRTGPMTSSGQSSNYVMTVTLPTKLPENHWIKAGTALFCQITNE
ncbi:axonemal inner arm dynein heavy chain 3 [Pelomyxa schiedti]|nr:axonemal inner arm dynein heavy chain 3 [Pelomyxa schiedti]